MLEDEKKQKLMENINQYNHLLGNFINKMEVKNDTSDNLGKEGEEEIDSSLLKQLQITKVRIVIIENSY